MRGSWRALVLGAAGLVVSGGNLWVCNYFAGTIGKYDATTGATINASLVSGLNNPVGIAVSGGGAHRSRRQHRP